MQGSKQVSLGTEKFSLTAGDSLLITADVPTVSQITQASAAEPYFSLVLELDLAIIVDLGMEMKLGPVDQGAAIRTELTDADVEDAALRLMRLLERPAALPVLSKQLLREMHYWLLVGKHGGAIRQKQLRLIEARRLMAAKDFSASSAAFAVGYESAQQFTREYRRLFGLPPGKDREAAQRAQYRAEDGQGHWPQALLEVQDCRQAHHGVIDHNLGGSLNFFGLPGCQIQHANLVDEHHPLSFAAGAR